MKIINISKHIVMSNIVSKVITFRSSIVLLLPFYLFLGLLGYLFILVAPQQAGPQSTTYEIKSYEFGSGGISGDTSTTYSLFGNSGQVDGTSLNSTTYTNQPGLTYLLTTNVPGSPTVSNNSNLYYNKLSVTLNTSNNPSDTVYAIKVVSSGTQYIQADNTLGVSPVWQTNTTWGASGFTVIGLTPGTGYTISVSARQGAYTQSAFGPSTTVSTANPTVSFSLNSNALTFPNLDPGTVKNSTSTITTTVSTNGVGGVTIYAYDSNNGLLSSGTSYSITAVSNDLSVTSEGYGLRTTAVGQSSGGPMEALSPYNGTGNNVGIINNANKNAVFDSTGASVTTGTGTFELQAKASVNAKVASDYTDILTVIATSVF